VLYVRVCMSVASMFDLSLFLYIKYIDNQKIKMFTEIV